MRTRSSSLPLSQTPPCSLLSTRSLKRALSILLSRRPLGVLSCVSVLSQERTTDTFLSKALAPSCGRGPLGPLCQRGHTRAQYSEPTGNRGPLFPPQWSRSRRGLARRSTGPPIRQERMSGALPRVGVRSRPSAARASPTSWWSSPRASAPCPSWISSRAAWRSSSRTS